jgi:hypothetical protein
MNDPSKKMSGTKIRGKVAFLPSLRKRALSHKRAGRCGAIVPQACARRGWRYIALRTQKPGTGQ